VFFVSSQHADGVSEITLQPKLTLALFFVRHVTCGHVCTASLLHSQVPTRQVHYVCSVLQLAPCHVARLRQTGNLSGLSAL
jgi:hypothetical protein